MFMELWIVKNGYCFFHWIGCEDPVAVDKYLLSGFLSALITFQERTFPEQTMRNIDFLDTRFVFFNNVSYILVVREETVKPLERITQQIRAVVTTLDQYLKTSDHPSLFEDYDRGRSFPDEYYNNFLGPIVNEIVEEIGRVDEKLRQFDVLSILLLSRDLWTLLQPMLVNCSDKNGLPDTPITQFLVREEKPSLEEIQSMDFAKLGQHVNYFFSSVPHHWHLGECISESTRDLVRKNFLHFIMDNNDVIKRFDLDDLFLKDLIHLVA